eukprot:TRINITY_DN1589_c0_g1_i1.p1 TRINITY_DN1589_c0_g1~~TRINITY_DN1589_c0_g1_i1.p1  ORF type:complete len:309 (-),score=110.12 TRINITY_DN1589_c0_g1_i1:11-937(-)
MGEAQSSEQNPQHEHNIQISSDPTLSPAQKAFSKSFKLNKKEWPLMTIKIGEEEIKYADTRPHTLIAKMDNKLHWEMFWISEFETLDQEVFLSQVKPVIEKYGGEISGEMREAGCMISMIAVPFLMTEENSYKMGEEMFEEFGTDKVIEKKKEDPHTVHKNVENVLTPAQQFYSVSTKLNKKEFFPLMNVKVGEQEFKYADTRPHMLPTIGEDLHWEMFWMGELENLNQKLFTQTVQPVIEKYGGRITSKMREAGCMISMVGIAFSMPEEKSIEMGKDMFEKFGEKITEEEKITTEENTTTEEKKETN